MTGESVEITQVVCDKKKFPQFTNAVISDIKIHVCPGLNVDCILGLNALKALKIDIKWTEQAIIINGIARKFSDLNVEDNSIDKYDLNILYTDYSKLKLKSY